MKTCTNCKHEHLNATRNPCRACLLARGYERWEAKPSDPHLVYLDGRNIPVVKHETLELAKAEALRLATEFGRKAYVVKVVASVTVKKTVTAKWEDA